MQIRKEYAQHANMATTKLKSSIDYKIWGLQENPWNQRGCKDFTYIFIYF